MSQKRFTAALAVLLLLLASIGPAVGTSVAGTSGDVLLDHDEDDGVMGDASGDGPKPADSAYVTDDGDVILVYDYDDDGEADSYTNVSGHAGMDVADGLSHMAFTGEYDSNVTGEATLRASDDELSVDGSLSAPKPETLNALSFDMTQVANDTQRFTTVDLESSVALPQDASMMGLLERIETAGTIESAPESMTANGSVTVSARMLPLPDREHHVLLSEDAGDFTLSVEESYIPENTSAWESRETATATLTEQYCPESTGGVECSVTVDSYSLEEGDTSTRLDLSYTVELSGVDSTVSTLISTGLSTSEANISEETVTQFASRVENISVSRVQADVVVADSQASLSWNVSLDGTDDLALAYADLLEVIGAASMDGNGMPGGPELMFLGGGPFGQSPAELADQIRAQVAATRAAGLTATTTWDATLGVESRNLTVDATVDSRAENWGSYVDEMESSDGTAPIDKRVTLTAGIDGDRVTVDGAASVRDEAMFDDAIAQIGENLEQYNGASNVTERLDTIADADFERARMDISASGDSLTVEGAMSIGNTSALMTALPENVSMIDAFYTDMDERATYVRLDGAFDGEVTESDVRALPYVDETTTVNLAGEWDRDFPSLDDQQVRNYLGSSSGSGDGAFPTVIVAGGAAALLAVGGALLLLRSR